jgi:hypothetical protein
LGRLKYSAAFGRQTGVLYAEGFIQHLCHGHPTDNILKTILGDHRPTGRNSRVAGKIVLDDALARISHHGVPLLGTSSVGLPGYVQHCLFQAVAHRFHNPPHGEKCAFVIDAYH